jgi:hypothetical protein
VSTTALRLGSIVTGLALMGLAGCAGGAPPSPTVQSAATQVAGAASPVAAQVAPAASPRNTSSSAVSLSGWRLQVGTASVTLPSSASVGPGQTATIHLAAGTNTATDIYLGDEARTLLSGLQPGARVALVNPQGQAVSEFSIPAM